MVMDWFRMYSEFASDPKVQSMPEAMQRRLMMLLCLKCSNTLVTLQDDEIAFALRITDEDLAQTKILFLRKRFIDDTWEIMNWDKRQFVSDSSAERVARHRAIKKEEEIQAPQSCNVTVTPQNRTDTEQIQNREEHKKPKATPMALPEWVPADAWQAFTAMRKSIKKPIVPDAIPIAIRKLDSLRAAGNDPGQVLEQSTMNSWQGLFEVKPENHAKGSPGGAWWATDSSVLAKGVDLGMSPNPGEQMQQFKGRIQAMIDNDGRPPEQRPKPVIVIRSDDQKGHKPEGLPPLNSLVKIKN